MLNKIVTDNNLDVQLLINLQSPRTFDETLLWDNSIYVEIDADDTATQSLEVDGGTYGSTSYPITPGQVNTIEIEDIYWNYDGTTTVTLVKGGSNVASFDIIFPEAVDSLGMLNQDESLFTQFTMSGSKSDPSDMAKEIGDISTEVEQISQDLSGKQNYIDKDILVPTGSGQVGDLVFNDGSGDLKRLYRFEEGNWVRVNFFSYGNSEPSNPEESDLFIENDGTKIISIKQYLNSDWIELDAKGVNDYSTSEVNTGIKWTDGRAVYQKTLSDSQSQSTNYNHNIGQLDKVIGYEGTATSYSGDDISSNYSIPSAEFDIKFTASQMQITQNISGTFDIDVTVKYLHKLGAYVFDQDFVAGSSYKFNKCNKETFLTNLINTWLRLMKPYQSGNAAYEYFKSNAVNIINGILQRVENYSSLAIGITPGSSGTQLSAVFVDVNAGSTDNTYIITSKTTAFGYDYCRINPSIQGPPYSGISFDVTIYGSGSINWSQIGGGGYKNKDNIGYYVQKYTNSDTYGITATNNGIHYI